MERRVAEEEQLAARQVAEPADDVVQAVDLHGRPQLRERRRGDVVRKLRQPRVERVEPVLAGGDERVGDDERLEPAPEPVDVDRHAAKAGMTDSPNALSTWSGSV